MPMKPNYRHERAQRARAKGEKKQEKLERKREAAAQRKTERDQEGDAGPGQASPGSGDAEGTD